MKLILMLIFSVTNLSYRLQKYQILQIILQASYIDSFEYS